MSQPREHILVRAFSSPGIAFVLVSGCFLHTLLFTFSLFMLRLPVRTPGDVMVNVLLTFGPGQLVWSHAAVLDALRVVGEYDKGS